MSTDLLLVALMAGLANWCFRALPILLMRGEAKPGGIFAAFLASTGPAAIATLVVASLLPQLWPEQKDPLPLAAGVVVTILVFLPKRSVVAATLAGAFACGLAYAVLHGGI